MKMRLPTLAIAVISVMAIGIGSAARAQVMPASQAPTQDPRMGTATHFDQGWDADQIMPLIADTGFGWIRDGVAWGTIERTKGVYQIPPRSLKWIMAAHQHHLKLILLLNEGNSLYENPYDPDAYARWAGEMARQLKDDVDCLEILNEPANFGFTKYYGGTWNGLEVDGKVCLWVGNYVTLMNKAAEAIKAANPNMKVIGLGSVSPVNFRQLAMGVSPAVDGMVDHPYSFQTVPELIPFPATPEIMKRDGIFVADDRGTFASLIREYREQSQRNHGPKEIWLTEWGFSTFQPSAPHLYSGFTPNAQAKYIQRRFVECIALGIEVSVLYEFKDDGTDIHNPEHHFGLLDSGLKPKPSYDAVRRMIPAVAGLRAKNLFPVHVFPAIDRPDCGRQAGNNNPLAAPGGIQTYQFENSEGKPVIAIWSTERADGDLMPRSVKVELVTDRTVGRIWGMNLLSGQQWEIPFKKEKECIVIADMTVLDSVVLLTVE